MGQSLRLEQEDRRRSDRIVVPGFGHRMRLAVAHAGLLLEVSVRQEGSDPGVPGVGAVAVNTVAAAPVTRQTWIFAPDSIHWPCLCPLFAFVRTAAPAAIAGVAGVTWSS